MYITFVGRCCSCKEIFLSDSGSPWILRAQVGCEFSGINTYLALDQSLQRHSKLYRPKPFVSLLHDSTPNLTNSALLIAGNADTIVVAVPSGSNIIGRKTYKPFIEIAAGGTGFTCGRHFSTLQPTNV